MRDDGIKRLRCDCGYEHWCWAWKCPACGMSPPRWGWIEHKRTEPKSWDDALPNADLPAFLRGAPASDVAAWCGFDLIEDEHGRVVATDPEWRFEEWGEVALRWVYDETWRDGELRTDASRWWVFGPGERLGEPIRPFGMTVEEFDDWLSWRELEPAHDHQQRLDELGERPVDVDLAERMGLAEPWAAVIDGIDGECPRCGTTTKHITLQWPRCQCSHCGAIHGLEGPDPRMKQPEQLALF